MPINLSTRALHAFVALADARSFTRAAAACHLSQPAFSALIAALERDVGARLFDRTTRSVEPTGEGLALLEPARRLLRDADDAVEGVRDLLARRRGRVALAVLPSLAAGWLPPRLASFRAAHPGVEVDVADVLSDECLERVRTGRADLGLAAAGRATPELRREPFCADAFHVVCPRGHALARQRRRVEIADLLPHPVVQLSRTSSVRQHLDAAVHPQRLRTAMELDQLATVAAMVRAGLGISVVPALTLFHFNDPALVARPLHAPGMVREIDLVSRAGRALSSAAQALRELMLRERPSERSPARARR